MMRGDSLEKRYTRRLNVLSVFFMILAVVFLGRLLDRQVLRRDSYTAQAQKQYYTEVEQPAHRGTIYIKDADSVNLIDSSKTGLFPVATDVELFDVIVTPKNVENKKDTAEKLASILGEDENTIFETINNDKWYVPPIKKRIDKDTADKITDLDLDGVSLDSNYSRVYPEKDFMAQLLGFVDYSGSGRYGVEEYYDGVLRGEGGTLKGLKDNLGNVIKVEQSAPGKDGASLVLTIDRSIQYMAEKKLKEGIERYATDGGSIVVADPKTGAVLAMASSPTYDPNKFNEVKTEDQGIFLNPTVSSNWEPGSIFKPVVVAAAVSDDKVEPDSKPTESEGGFSDSVTIDGYEIHNSLKKAYGYETVTQILENSDNIGMVWVANKLGDEVMYNYLKKFGFGEKTGIDLAGEASGQVSSYKKWQDVNRATISFGQGISVTPIQMIQAFSAIANNGEMVKPHVVDKIMQSDDDVKEVETTNLGRVVSEEDAKKVTDMLISVVENGHGKKAKVDGYKVAGKTGTAQIPKSGGGYEEEGFIGSFIGYAPAYDPKFVMLVKFNRPKNVEWAESSAAPIFGEMADWLLNDYWKVQKDQ